MNTALSSECESAALVAVIGGQDHVAGHARETVVNGGLGREIAVGGQGHEIDDVGQGHVIEGSTGQGHIHENVYDGKTNRVEEGLTMKSNMRKNCPSIQLSARYVSLLSVHASSIVLMYSLTGWLPTCKTWKSRGI